MKTLQTTIETAFDQRSTFTPESTPMPIHQALYEVLNLLDIGTLRVAEKVSGNWITHEWIKKAILLFFKTQPNHLIDAGYAQFYDKLPLKFHDLSEAQLSETGVRIVPPAYARKGAYVAKNTVLMPSYINVGAYVDSGTLIDTWATVGSCAQIGKNTHISGGVGIGGVLEPLQASPVIIEDNCFIGARSEIVEGVIVEENSVISMGVYLGQSTQIYNRLTDEVTYGRIPAGSVVIPGSLPDKTGKYARYCAIIMKQVDANTRAKTSTNQLLREQN